MSETQTPSYEQVVIDLRANQVAVDVTRSQRNAALNEAADIAARLDQAVTALQALGDEKAKLLEQVTTLTARLAVFEPAAE